MTTVPTTSSPVSEAAARAAAEAPGYRFLQDNFAPVHEEVTRTELTVTGSIPTELEGRYVRTGPNPIAPDPERHHWFVGEGMVHGIRLSGGRAAWYRNRYVRSDVVAMALGEDAVPHAEGGVVPGLGNTNVVHHAGMLLALMELSLPFELGPDLDTRRTVNFGGPLPVGVNAHPKFDPATGEMHVVGYTFGDSLLRYHVIDAAGHLARSTEIALGGPVMVHDMALTPTWAVAFDLPVRFSMDAAVAGKGLPYRWDPNYTPRVGLVPREGTGADTVWFELTEPGYVYHVLNSFDGDDGSVAIDLVVHPRAFDDAERGDPSQGIPSMQRWVLDPAARTVTTTVIDDRGQEFPRADERRAGQPYRYGYSVGVPSLAAMGGGTGEGGSLLGYDLELGTVAVHDFGVGRTPSEFVFVPASEVAGENEGWVMGYVHDGATDTSVLEILDATDLPAAPVATIDVGVRVPQGFHGNWVPDTVLAGSG